VSRLQTWRGGSEDGPLVLFLPGCPDSRWAALPGSEPALRAGVRLVGVNRPGYGDSLSAPSTHRSVADDLVAVADDLGAEWFGLLGMSVGGTYALACAAAHPGRVTGVVTVSAPGDLGRMEPPHHRDGLSAQQAEQLARVQAAPSVEQAIDLLRAEFEDYRDRTLREVSMRSSDDRRVRQDVEALSRPDGYLRDAAAMLRAWEWDPSGVRCPVLVVHGARDAQASVRNAHWLAAAVPGARLRILEDADHLEALSLSWELLVSDLAAGLRPV
jgi:pimeloyl-ACP methyl ester carboxylesterase